MLPGERRRPDSWTCWTSCRTQTQAGARAGGRVSFPLCLLIYFGSSTSETPEMSRLPAAGPRGAERCPASQSLSRGDPGSCHREGQGRAARAAGYSSPTLGSSGLSHAHPACCSRLCSVPALGPASTGVPSSYDSRQPCPSESTPHCTTRFAPLLSRL